MALRQSIFRQALKLATVSLTKTPSANFALYRQAALLKPTVPMSGARFPNNAVLSLASVRQSTSQALASEKRNNHARHFKIERMWAAGMLPLLPAALFIHGPVMDYALAIAVALHIHWGLVAVIEDYARPFVIGETLTKLSHYAIYGVSIAMLIGMLHFNYNDVGITKAFEMVWSL